MTEVRPPTAALADLGVRAGSMLLVHASLRRTGLPAVAVLAALRDVLGPDGTLVVPAFTAGNSDTSPAYRKRTRNMTDEQRVTHHATMPPFDPASTPSQGMGMLAETVRCERDAVRSVHPQTSFAAVGARAAELLAGHAEDCHLGEHSPLARLYAADARVLLIGVGYEVCSALHLAEYRISGVPWREYRCVVLRDRTRRWISYKDVDLDDSDFGALGAAFEAHDATLPVPVVRRSQLGLTIARLVPMRAAVDFAADWLTRNRRPRRTTNHSQIAADFLH